MAGEPKRRHSKGQKRTRRAAIKLAVNLVMCKNCGKPSLSHIVCESCGFYGGKSIKKPARNASASVAGGEKVQVTKV